MQRFYKKSRSLENIKILKWPDSFLLGKDFMNRFRKWTSGDIKRYMNKRLWWRFIWDNFQMMRYGLCWLMRSRLMMNLWKQGLKRRWSKLWKKLQWRILSTDNSKTTREFRRICCKFWRKNQEVSFFWWISSQRLDSFKLLSLNQNRS